MRLVIDTDAGVDDAVAILLALHAFPGEQVVGITTVFGNVNVHQANHNVKHILQAAGRSQISVHSGASKAIISSVSEVTWAGHGPDGLGGESGKAEAPVIAAQSNKAAHALIDLAYKYSGQLVIAALGPLTNIALAILLDPNFMVNIKKLVVMGGLSPGNDNHTMHAEFNVSCDPEATEIVYQHSNALKLYVLPFDTSLNNAISWEKFDKIFHEKVNSHGEYIKRIWKFTRACSKNDGFLPCDAHAIAILLHPDFVKSASALRGRIHLAPDGKRGACIWGSNFLPDQANVTLVTHIDNRVFNDLLNRLAV
ncbi:uncharacterized protein CCR75_009694 [Bremia lactucae]|uniref:Inosine/uridine-preferring nucleoside hydrolase domain-containing protein n=1 Tax=Bremia lactucae TaxID=4779 RepID=A0A976FKG8_BRELC|nr:hypothetical protein CCR75_009694 [Bremia lactucae]